MLSHYLEEITDLEFSERNLEIPQLVTFELSKMNERGILVSSITLQNTADFFADEFHVRCDFILNFMAPRLSLLLEDGATDILTEAKSMFYASSIKEKEHITSQYKTTIKKIEKSLVNSSFKTQIEERLEKKIDSRIKKNNMHIEVTCKELAISVKKNKRILILQPNFQGIGIDIRELWNKYRK